MAAYTDSLGFNKGSPAFPDANNPTAKMEVVLNFATIAAARAAAGATALAATDTLEVIPVPAGTLVLAVGAEVTKAEGGTATMDVGDSGSATRYLSNADLNALGTTVSALSSPYYYSAAGNIRITLDHNSIDAAVVRVWAIVADCA
jgi:hypothetical protein